MAFLCENIPVQDDRVFVHRQVKLPDNEADARERADAFLEKVLDRGGEGVVIRDPRASWFPKRNRGLLKHKPFDDLEVTIVGFMAGREGKQSNVLGKIGALRVRWHDIEFEIGSGMTMAERELADDARDYATAHFGEVLPDWCDGRHLKRGQTVTFKYRELSDDGVPKEARFWRRREGVE